MRTRRAHRCDAKLREGLPVERRVLAAEDHHLVRVRVRIRVRVRVRVRVITSAYDCANIAMSRLTKRTSAMSWLGLGLGLGLRLRLGLGLGLGLAHRRPAAPPGAR